MRKIKILLLIVLSLYFCLFSITVFANKNVEIIVQADINTGLVNNKIFGSNIKAYSKKYENGTYGNKGGGVWNPVKSLPAPEFVELAREAGLTSMRWPGGVQARYANWKLMVGPLETRPRQQFGLPEFLEYCSAINAVPVITLPATRETIKSASDLVAYLNLEYETGSTSQRSAWPKRRYDDGKSQPWNVIWFELGNETYDTYMAAEEYVDLYRKVRSAMKAVDSNVMLGAVIEETSNLEDGWGHTILSSLGDEIDYLVAHAYTPDLWKGAVDHISAEDVAMAALSSDANLEETLSMYIEAAGQHSIKQRIPIAITEFNGNYNLDKPHPYRFTLFNAIHIADMLRVFLKPEYGILFTNQWLFANSYWGAVTGGLGKSKKITKQANHHIYHLYHEYLGDNFLAMDINSDKMEFDGRLGISPRLKQKLKSNAAKGNIDTIKLQNWKTRLLFDGSQNIVGDVLQVNFDESKDVNYYHASQEIKVEPDATYIVSAEIRTLNLQGGTIGIVVEDAKGWKQTFHQKKKIYLTGSSGWKTATVRFHTGKDTKKIRIIARRMGGNGVITGRAEFGPVKVKRVEKAISAVPAITGLASINHHSGDVSMILLNKDLKKGRDVSLVINGSRRYKFIRANMVTGNDFLANNYAKTGYNRVEYTNLSAKSAGENMFTFKIPPVSAVGLLFSGQ